MKIAIVTPYYAGVPQEWLLQCYWSVRQQSHPCQHVLIIDGPVTRPAEVSDVLHIDLPERCGDYGDTPRAIAAIFAANRGFDGVAFLDADNWYEPEHIQSLVALHEASGAALLSSGRMLHRLDGSVLGTCAEVDGKAFVDTSCLLLTRPAYPLLNAWWAMPGRLHAVGDRVFWANVLKSKISHAHSGHPTLAYRTGFAHHYRQFGEPPPEGAKSGEDIGRAARGSRRS